MPNIKYLFIFSAMALLSCQIFLLQNKNQHKPPEKKQVETKNINIETYDGIINQLEIWNKSFASISKMNVYGKTSEGKECVYFKIGTPDKPKILIHSGVNGYEKSSTIATMKLIDKLLHDQDEEVIWLINNREMYFIPVVSPDLYSNQSQKVIHFPTGTKFNNDMNASVKNLVDFSNDMKFKAVLNLHADGKNICYSQKTCKKDLNKIHDIAEKMSSLCGYDIVKNYNDTNKDVDWFYSTGSCSITFNTTDENIKQTYDAFLSFIKEAAESDMNPQPIRPIFYQAD